MCIYSLLSAKCKQILYLKQTVDWLNQENCIQLLYEKRAGFLIPKGVRYDFWKSYPTIITHGDIFLYKKSCIQIVLSCKVSLQQSH